jgi:hypothetical protein
MFKRKKDTVHPVDGEPCKEDQKNAAVVLFSNMNVHQLNNLEA